MPHPSTVFERDWLASRETADHAARSQGLTDRLSDWLAEGVVGPYRLCDLGCGSGSNVRYLASRLPAGQYWHLLDHDAGLLEEASERCRSLAGVVGLLPQQGDLVKALEALVPDGAALVTASALLDLMSAPWLEQLVRCTVQRRAACLMTLSYSGEIELMPRLADDGWINRSVNAHQQQDKGSGPALGPGAWSACEAMFRRAGYRVFHEPATWSLGASQGELQEKLLTGWARAVTEWRPASAGRIARWLDARLALVQRGESRIRVSHQDLLALPDVPYPAAGIRW
ncbi:class I SAM-dependent methyltransferase [Marinobacter halodurans]|uniref:Class I SAM-dependent methyltransferase n=1 Tax=Marinobacter halodurans TaxID=2528979 RepID=A0ABY1ZH91_9GAMM|nr:class I SAM-dependent methyltransferase [Marinobacter halodurans]TBW51552.1 class I SAM-dependent methyltransferase [Marinobacter halodurans]